MKLRIYFMILLSLVSASLFAQAYNLIKIETNRVVNMDAEQAWLLVQDWQNLNKLVPNVVQRTKVRGTGLDSSWDIYLNNGGLIKETMIYYNTNQKTISYTMTETPMPIKNYLAIIKVEPYGVSKSLVSFYTSCLVGSENEENIINAFTSFQETYLSNIEKQNDEQ